MAILEGRNLRKTYRLGKRNYVAALRGVDVAIEAGEMVAIMGPSGSGQEHAHAHPRVCSTLRTLDDGPRPALSFDGRDMVALGESAADEDPGPRDGLRVPGVQPHPDAHRARERHARGRLRGHRRQARRDRRRWRRSRSWVSRTVRTIGRPSSRGASSSASPSLAHSSTLRGLVLADEPTGNLDSQRSTEVLAMLRRFNRERGQTFVLVTHDTEVGDACDRVIRMRDGRIREERVTEVATAPLPDSERHEP